MAHPDDPKKIPKHSQNAPENASEMLPKCVQIGPKTFPRQPQEPLGTGHDTMLAPKGAPGTKKMRKGPSPFSPPAPSWELFEIIFSIIFRSFFSYHFYLILERFGVPLGTHFGRKKLFKAILNDFLGIQVGFRFCIDFGTKIQWFLLLIFGCVLSLVGCMSATIWDIFCYSCGIST